MSDPIITRCPVGCNSTLEDTNIVLPEGPLRRCPACGQLVSACTQERYDESMQDFNVEDGTMPKDRAIARQRQRMGKILRNAVKQSGKKMSEYSLLDVGCSSGSLLLIAREMGFTDIKGVEPAEKAAETAKKLGFNIFTGFLDQAAYPDNSFDIVTLFEVIEHLEEAQSIAREIHRILKPGGLWVFTTANAASWTAATLRHDWDYFSIAQNGGHISFFNPTSIRQLAKNTGFEAFQIQTKRTLLFDHRKGRSPVKKIAGELLSFPARLAGQGHDMQLMLRKPEQ